MATCSKYEQGYDDNRFEIVVGEEFHCSICLLVLKDPVMCQNQHYYCSSCIKEHLANSEFCPTCREHLSVDTLIQVPRIVTDYLSKLNIHCDFYATGCREVTQLSNLKRHVASCGFSPVQCSNDGCNVLVNKRDKLHHEAEVCDFRKSKCHDCGHLKKEVKEMKDEMLRRQDQMKNEMKYGMNEVKVMIDQVLACQLEDKMRNENGKVAIKNQVKNEMKEMKEEIKNEVKEMKEQMIKEMKEKMIEEMKEMVINAVRDSLVRKKDEEVVADIRENIIVTGGHYKEDEKFVRIKSTECFNWTDQTWSLLHFAAFEGRSASGSFLYQGQMIVAGGFDGVNRTNTLKCLNVADPAATWKDFAVNLPVRCSCHQVVNYNDRLFMSGGWIKTTNTGLPTCSDAVNEVQLVSPYSSKMLTRLPQPRYYHGMELFDNKLFILGGHDDKKVTNSVIQYDLIQNECKEMPPLPYPVQEMATVLWRNNVLVIGGRDESHAILNSVFMYDVVTGHSQMLSCMKRKRYGCTAVSTGNVVVVMGGYDDCPKSVECFDLERQVWHDLPDMLEPRAFATAVVKPNQ